MKRVALRFLVWNMRWMTRYVGFLARPIVRLYANQEVIACGLRETDGSVSLIYTPWPGRSEYQVVARRSAQWEPRTPIPAQNFSGSVVLRATVPDAQVGEHYKITAKNHHGRLLASPEITIKERTVYDRTVLSVLPHTNGTVTFKWKDAQKFDALIYFLAVEDEEGETCAALYTRETQWTYPHTQRASLSVGPPARTPELQSGKKYTAKLLLVDFDGWVSHFATQSFSLTQ